MNINNLLELDEKFRVNDCFGEDKLPTLEFKKGILPIIVTSPHSVKTRKLNKKDEDVIKENENFTGAFAMFLNECVGVHAMVRNNYPYNTYVDPRGEYIELVNYIKRFDIKYLVDLHGAARKHKFDLAIGTNNGMYIDYDERYNDAITSSFNDKVEIIDFNCKFNAKNPRTISNFVHTFAGIKTTQLEINRNYRDKSMLENLKRMILGLIDYTDELEKLIKEENFSKTLKL